MKLRVLKPEGRRLVTAELAAGMVERWPETTWRPLVDEHERLVTLEELDALVDRAVRTFARHDPALEPWLAPRLHAALPITRREAAQPGVWRYLAVVHRPDLIRHRWEDISWSATKLRYWSVGTRHTSSLFGRLWWIAELTRDGASYGLTERVLARPSIATQVFVRAWSQHRPAVEAFVAELSGAPAEAGERAARGLSRHLATVPLELLDASELRRVIRAAARS